MTKAGKVHPFKDIAERLLWHRSLLGLTQEDYAASFGFKRQAYSLWEAGGHRLSLDGALALRKRYGLSLDFMYEGIDDALPMTLRNAWRELQGQVAAAGFTTKDMTASTKTAHCATVAQTATQFGFIK